MIEHRVRVHKSAQTPPREALLAWKMAAVAADDATLDADVIEMIVNRVIDNAGVAAAGLTRRPVANARAQALNHAVHVTATTRQSRKGEISTWKANAPAHAAKLAVEAVDRALRGETSPAPIYEGDDSIIAWLLDGADAEYVVALPAPGESKRAILETFTKAHSAEIQAQPLIDLAFHMRRRIPDVGAIERIVIHTSHHTHLIIGTGSGDPQKFDPCASRETLDHSAMYIFAVALEDGVWDHVESYRPQRAAQPSTVALWRRISTLEDAEWTRRYHSLDPRTQAFEARVVISLADGSTPEDEIAFADAHPLGARPFRRDNYVAKFTALASIYADAGERKRFLDTALRLPELPAGNLIDLTLEVPPHVLEAQDPLPSLFDRAAS